MNEVEERPSGMSPEAADVVPDHAQPDEAGRDEASRNEQDRDEADLDADLDLDLGSDLDSDMDPDSRTPGFEAGQLADGPAPSAFVLPLGALGLGAYALRWAAAAWQGAAAQWWDPVLAALAGLGLLAFGLPRLGQALRGLIAFAVALRPEPVADSLESPDRERLPTVDPAASSHEALRSQRAPLFHEYFHAYEGEPLVEHADPTLTAGGGLPGATATALADPSGDAQERPKLLNRLAGLGAGLRRPVVGQPWLPGLEKVAGVRLTLACGFGAVALSLALITQQQLDALAIGVGGEGVVLGMTLLGILLLVMALAMAMEALAPEVVADAPLASVPAATARGPRSWMLAAAGLALALLTVAFSSRVGAQPPPIALLRPWPEYANATLQPLGLLLWLCGLTLLIVALREPGRGLLEIFGGWIGAFRRPEAWLLLAILGLGAWLRFHDLLNLPAEMTSDHTEKLNDVRTMLEGGLRPVFLPGNAGREAMEFYWLAFLMGPLGLPVSFQTMKIGMGLVSLLNILLMYRLGKELGGTGLALAAAFLLAVAPWHLLITRIALRIAFAPLFVTLVAWLLFRAIRTGHRNDWLALGASMALGIYGYTAYRAFLLVVPVVLVVKLLHDAWHHRGEGRRLIPAGLPGHLVAALLVAVALALPLLRYSRDYAESFNHRSITRLVGDQPLQGAEFDKALDLNLKTQLLPNIKRALWMFNVTSDGAWFQSPPGRPALETVSGALFLLGLAILLVRAWRRDWRYLALALAIPLMLATSFMALAFPRENPSLSRASGALPLAIVIAALPLTGLIARWRTALGRSGLIGASAACAGLLLWMTLGSVERYFVEYRQIYDQSTHNTSEGAAAVRLFLAEEGGDIDHVYYVGWENGWDFRALAYLLGEPKWNGLISGQKTDWSDAATGASNHVGDPAAKLYLVGGPFAQAQLVTLQGFFPAAKVQEQTSRVAGKDFWTVIVPPRDGGASK